MATFSGKFPFKPIHIYWLGFSFASASVEWKLRTATCTSILLTKISQRSLGYKLPHLAPLCDESQSHTDVCYCLSDCRFLGASLLLPSAFNRSVGYYTVAQSETNIWLSVKTARSCSINYVTTVTSCFNFIWWMVKALASAAKYWCHWAPKG